jgi:hypothetical protein
MQWAGIEPGPVGVGFVIDKITFELHVTCTTVGQMTEFEISLYIYTLIIHGEIRKILGS